NCRGDFGVKLGRGNEDLVSMLGEAPTPGLAFVILAGGDHPFAGEWAERFQGQWLAVFWEAVSVEEMKLGQRLGIWGLLLKGHGGGGRVGDGPTFILLQRGRAEFGPQTENPLPAWVQGGIGLNTAAGSIAAGASGVVLDNQLPLAKESPLKRSVKPWL